MDVQQIRITGSLFFEEGSGPVASTGGPLVIAFTIAKVRYSFTSNNNITNDPSVNNITGRLTDNNRVIRFETAKNGSPSLHDTHTGEAYNLEFFNVPTVSGKLVTESTPNDNSLRFCITQVAAPKRKFNIFVPRNGSKTLGRFEES
ncbi:hypothetical protein IC620_16310 [Hazenella sp. IB182357]|uniref:Uncharacterized protein n=1 Tax=Polycladospora coralii TaxID=2771432 RepID=A0A926N754_9BACL|nr:hypothetical protein [Polycladospora coralii]MBD1373909.1 hypothetical protein [Polycladospora coralii]